MGVSAGGTGSGYPNIFHVFTWWVDALDREGVRMLDIGPRTMRAVTSLAVDDEAIDHVIRVIQSLAN